MMSDQLCIGCGKWDQMWVYDGVVSDARWGVWSVLGAARYWGVHCRRVKCIRMVSEVRWVVYDGRWVMSGFMMVYTAHIANNKQDTTKKLCLTWFPASNTWEISRNQSMQARDTFIFGNHCLTLNIGSKIISDSTWKSASYPSGYTNIDPTLSHKLGFNVLSKLIQVGFANMVQSHCVTLK